MVFFLLLAQCVYPVFVVMTVGGCKQAVIVYFGKGSRVRGIGGAGLDGKGIALKGSLSVFKVQAKLG